ncbi:hypothetical protein Cadr_000007484 [Camelus dromedarius]|uniref:Uncharacterized protein n=1 Tax=Camelus dromedarius TaxID=9838 RepID=A0A5N4E7S9_CAMDR|nr:hypothetical protein Cadr_000007484 [Camelus dromedarius]
MSGPADLTGETGVDRRCGEQCGWGGRGFFLEPGLVACGDHLIMIFLAGRLMAASCLLTPGRPWHHHDQVSKLGKLVEGKEWEWFVRGM